ARLVVLTGDVHEVFTQNYRYQSVLEWLRQAVRDLVVHYVADGSLQAVQSLFQQKRDKPLLLLNTQLLLARERPAMIALVQSRLPDADAPPLLLSFPLPSAIPDELYAPSLGSFILPIRRLTAGDPRQLLSFYLEEKEISVALDEVKPALKGLSNQDI